MNIKKWVVLGLSLWILVFVGVWLFSYLGSGKLVVIGESPASIITVTNQNGRPLKSASSKLSVRLKASEYVVSVSSGSQTTKKTVVVHARKTSTYKIVLSSYSVPEPVSSSNGTNMVAGPGLLRYFDTSLERLTSIYSSGKPTYSAVSKVDGIQWSDPDYGIGKTTDGNLFIIRGSTITPLDIPDGQSSYVSYAINSKKQIYIANQTSVYFGTPESGFKKIYTAASISPTIIPSSDKFALITSKTSANKTRGSEIKADISIISNSGSLLASGPVNTSDNLGSQIHASWSPDGSNLVVSNNGSVSSVFDAGLLRLQNLPQNDISNTVWLDNTSLLYSTDNKIWSYSLKNHQSQIISQFATDVRVNETSLAKDSSYLYLSTGDKSYGGVYRVGLKHQAVSSTAIKMGVFLPFDTGECLVNFVNFIRPVVVVMPYSALSESTCLTKANSTLSDDRIDTNSLPLFTTTILQSAGD